MRSSRPLLAMLDGVATLRDAVWRERRRFAVVRQGGG
jgi:hypothetical protein